MREIKFRGKTKDGNWVIGSHFTMHHTDDRLHIHHFIIPDNTSIPKSRPIGEIQVEVIPESVGQFTGLHDKDGKEVYEGDIVECVSWNEYFDDGSGTPEPFRRFFRVAFKAPAFVLYEAPLFEGFQERCFSAVPDGDLTILGNLTDNPQLYGTK